MDEIVIPLPTPQTRARNRDKLVLMHPVVFIGIWALLGTLFALQERLNHRRLANTRLSALRKLNLHLLFNPMNRISSLMRTDVDAADEMLEQLTRLLRINLKRGSARLIPLHEEIEFIEVYLSMQDRRYSDRIRRLASVNPELHDVLVPAMILQPLGENAYAYGHRGERDDG